MSEHLHPLPLPNDTEYYRAVSGVERTVKNSHDSASNALLSQFGSSDRLKLFSQAVYSVGQFLEPVHEGTNTPRDPRLQIAGAFHLGAIASTVVAQKVHGEQVEIGSIWDTIGEIGVPDTEDRGMMRAQVGEEIMRLGDIALEETPDPILARVDALSELTVLDVTKQRYFSVGYGVVRAAGYRAHKNQIYQYERQQLETAIESAHDFDWDTDFRGILHD